MESTSVASTATHHVFLYALSTCGWCKKTKLLLHELGVPFDFVDVDLLTPDQQDTVSADMDRWNPDGSFPTLVIDNQFCIKGYQPEEISRLVDQ